VPPTTDGATADAVPSDAFDPFDPEVQQNLYAHCAALRERAPVVFAPAVGAWLVTRHKEAAQAFTDRRLGKSPLQEMGRSILGPAAEGWLFLHDPPNHTRLRLLVNKAFLSSRVAELRARSEQVAARLLTAVHGRESFDLLEDFAWQIPVAVIGSWFGLPEESFADFECWGRAMFIATDARDPEVVKAGADAAASMYLYLADLVEARRAQPGSALIDDLMAVRDGADRLSDTELIGLAGQLLLGGYDTTANQIGNTVLSLLSHRSQWERLVADPSLAASAFEEGTRFESVAQFLTRCALEDVEIAGEAIPAGAFVGPVVGSANRDPRRFADPDRFDITRSDSGHLTYGRGIHVCLGAPLARLNGEVALRALATRLPGLELADPTPHWRSTFVTRALTRLPVAVRQ